MWNGRLYKRCSRIKDLAGKIAPFQFRPGIVCIYLSLLTACFAQIGGQTSADGPFTLDNIEDLDINAAGVDRDWIPDYVKNDPNAFAPIQLESSGLPLYDNQTSVGAFRFSMPSKSNGGYVSYSFGVPMPSVPGQSTVAYPGDLTSFTDMTFLISSDRSLANQTNSILLETNTASTAPFPQLVWNFDMPADAAFHRVTIPLREPAAINNNTAGNTIEELLAKTRYLAFYFFGGPQSPAVTLTVHVDDIRFVGDATQSAISDWSIY